MTISTLSFVALGFFLGTRHATDADHVVAVTTIVSGQRSLQLGDLGDLSGEPVRPLKVPSYRRT